MSNLKLFQKGHSGNPSGRPPKLPKLDVLLAEVCTHDEMKAVLVALVAKAKSGHIRAVEILWDRCYGKSKSEILFTDQTPKASVDITKLSQPALNELLSLTTIENETEETDQDFLAGT